MTMHLRFDAHQSYQLDAIAAVVELFAGQRRIENDLQLVVGQTGLAAVPNRLELDDEALLANLQRVQRTYLGRGPDDDAYQADDALALIEHPLDNGSERRARFANFSIEMETGTGKTYVYVRTALELHQRYGMSKFIVVVPSIAIREGVLKTLEMTRDHLRGLYGNLPYRYYAYDSGRLSQVRHFALSNCVEIMVMTLAAFNSDANLIRRSSDHLQGETPLHLVQAARPILILDEPQNMESEKSVAALASLDPLLALRYSATHRVPYNIVYRLTPWEAYRRRLVKRIEVAAVAREEATQQPYILLESIRARKQTLTARLRLHVLQRGGTVTEKTVTVRPGDDLSVKTSRALYDGYTVQEINAAGGYLLFSNGVELAQGEAIGADKEALFEAQIRYTVQEHLRKQERLRERGIKVLSLFFIDRVANYAPADGLIRRLFEQAFDEEKMGYAAWRDLSADQVQAAYFAQHRTREGKVLLQDSKTGEAQRDQDTYDLIMKDKERLLSFEEPVAFVFSHSALREGWDSPNVFQVCTLNQSLSDIKKRQEIGRGVRLAVDQTGERVHDESLNILTVVANESYEQFVAGLQDELAFEYRGEIEARYGRPLDELSPEERRQVEAEYGRGLLPPLPANARQRTTVRLRKAYTLRPEFQELWQRVMRRTRYHVHIDTPRLVDAVCRRLAEVEIGRPRITVTKAQVGVDDDNLFAALSISGAQTMADLAGRYPLPNMVDLLSERMQHTQPSMRLTRGTLLAIIGGAPAPIQEAMLANPEGYAREAVRIIKACLAEQLVDGIEYVAVDKWYCMTQLEETFEAWSEHLVPSRRFDGRDGAGLYDQVLIDSEQERRFVEGLELRRDVRLYIKLPAWFTVPTPIGNYNPDWAIVLQDPDAKGQGEPLLYLVRETKSTLVLDDLRPDEARKIACGKRHFGDALKVDFKVARTMDEVP